MNMNHSIAILIIWFCGIAVMLPILAYCFAPAKEKSDD